jgi:hypothetical protein
MTRANRYAAPPPKPARPGPKDVDVAVGAGSEAKVHGTLVQSPDLQKVPQQDEHAFEPAPAKLKQIPLPGGDQGARGYNHSLSGGPPISALSTLGVSFGLEIKEQTLGLAAEKKSKPLSPRLGSVLKGQMGGQVEFSRPKSVEIEDNLGHTYRDVDVKISYQDLGHVFRGAKTIEALLVGEKVRLTINGKTKPERIDETIELTLRNGRYVGSYQTTLDTGKGESTGREFLQNASIRFRGNEAWDSGGDGYPFHDL